MAGIANSVLGLWMNDYNQKRDFAADSLQISRIMIFAPVLVVVSDITGNCQIGVAMDDGKRQSLVRDAVAAADGRGVRAGAFGASDGCLAHD